MPDVSTWDDPQHGLAIDIPTRTPSGAAVEVVRAEEGDGVHRLHAHSPDGSEVYVEITSYPTVLDHGPASEEQRHRLIERDPAGQVSSVREDRVLGRRAVAFDFDGVLGGVARRRRFVLVDLGPRTVRIVSDPSSTVNDRIIGTLRWTEASRS